MLQLYDLVLFWFLFQLLSFVIGNEKFGQGGI